MIQSEGKGIRDEMRRPSSTVRQQKKGGNSSFRSVQALSRLDDARPHREGDLVF